MSEKPKSVYYVIITLVVKRNHINATSVGNFCEIVGLSNI